MGSGHIRIRANRRTGDLEIEGSAELVNEWWEKVWPLVSDGEAPLPQTQSPTIPPPSQRSSPASDLPELFGEYFSQFRTDMSDVERVLIAAAYVQGKDSERAFTTKIVNQLLIDQNIKIVNVSERVRRLINTRRAFVISDGRFRVSATGFEAIQSLRQGE